MIKITALLLAVLLSLAIIPTVSLTPAKAQNDTSTDNVTSSVNQTITNETTVETNATVPVEPGPGGEFPAVPPEVEAPEAIGNETAPPAANVTVPPLEETLPPGNVSQSEPTAIQIQLIPNIQRGHNQHLTLFLVDDVGSVVPDEQMQANITNARGNLVGLKSFTTESGTEQTYKVGPNTSPQNITVFAQLPDTNITAQEEYSVFAKITAPSKPNNTQTEPEPLPPANVTGGNTTAPPVNSTITPPSGNSSGNATTSFDKLENSTAILEQEIAQGDENGNETDRAEVKGAVSETLTSLGAVASEVATATNFQLGTIGSTAEAVADAIDQILT